MRTTLISLMFLLFWSHVSHAEPLKFVANDNFAPYSMFESGKPIGMDVELFQEAARRAGIQYTLELLPWSEVMAQVRSGRCDGAFSLFRSAEREEFALYVEEAVIHYSDYVLFVRNGRNITFQNWDDLKGKRVGVKQGFQFSDEFDGHVDRGDIEKTEFPGESENIGALLKGSIDAFVGQLDTAYYQLDRMGMSSTIIYLPKVVSKDRPAYIALSRNSPLKHKEQIGQRLGIALRSMYRDGTYNKIARRYLFRF